MSDPRYEAYQEWLALRTASMERRAKEMGITVYELERRYAIMAREQEEWTKILKDLGYREGEGPVEFLRRVNRR